MSARIQVLCADLCRPRCATTDGALDASTGGPSSCPSTGPSTGTSGADKPCIFGVCSKPTRTSQSRDSRECVPPISPLPRIPRVDLHGATNAVQQELIKETEALLEKWKHPDPYRPPTAPGGMQLPLGYLSASAAETAC
jgi:hypothetical protein